MPQPRERGGDRVAEQELYPIAVHDVGGVHRRRENEPFGIYEQMALAPLHLLAASKPRTPPTPVAFTDWLSMHPALGWGSRPSRRRNCSRSVVGIRSQVPSRRNKRGWTSTHSASV